MELHQLKHNLFVITAAGGNATAIRILNYALDRAGYEKFGRQMMSETESDGVEQCGFLIPDDNRFEMSGGEFCGNAARAVAILFSQIKGVDEVEFTMSGFSGKIRGQVTHLEGNNYQVVCTFEGMSVESKSITANNQPAHLVDLGGIVHVIIEGKMPENYEEIHRQITSELKLTERDAVGVCWISRSPDSIEMHPVVWVKGINSFFYETSCGSGTIAVGKTTNGSSIIQPSGQSIQVEFTDSAVVLESDMAITKEGGVSWDHLDYCSNQPPTYYTH